MTTKEQLFNKLDNADAMFFIDGSEKIPSVICNNPADEYNEEESYCFVNNGIDGMFDFITVAQLKAASVRYDEDTKIFTVEYKDADGEMRKIGMQFLYIV